MVALSMSRVLVSGASGLIGSQLIPALKASGAHVVRLERAGSTRKEQNKAQNGDYERIEWEPDKPLAGDVVSGFDGVIHLAGESIMGRWTDAKKARIRNSRVTATRNLSKALAQAAEKPQVFVCSSAIGYYGNRGDEVLREDSAPGQGFLPDVCREWETATKPAFDAGIRTLNLRTGIVLSSKGGALKAMLTPFKLGVGGRVGDGRQWMSWIEMQDMVGGILHVLKTDLLQGAVNMVAPRPVTNAEFTKTLSSVLSRPAIFPVPAFAAKLAFGEMAEALLLGSLRVEPMRLIESGYPFRFQELRAALEKAVRE